jgi:hypothetical protein
LATTTNKPSVITLFTNVQAGIDKHITGSTTLGGVTYSKPAALKAVFAAAITALNTADALRKQWSDGVLAAHQAKAAADVLYELLRNFVIALYGKQANAVLGDFGMPVPKAKGPQTVAQKATSAAKAKATRKMRNTMGSVQKKKVKGTIEVPNPELSGTAPTTAPVTTASAPAAPATPATTPPAATATPASNVATSGGTKPAV